MKRCPHGQVVQLPDFPCFRPECPMNVAPAPAPAQPERTRAHAIRWRGQYAFDEPWSDWHVFVRVDGSARGTRCRRSVDIGPFSVERAAISLGQGAGKCAECFA